MVEKVNEHGFFQTVAPSTRIVLPVQQQGFLISVHEQRSGCDSAAQKDPFCAALH